jgi:hypothetical protein
MMTAMVKSTKAVSLRSPSNRPLFHQESEPFFKEERHSTVVYDSAR